MDTFDVRKYLCPIRCISFDGFVTYEGRRFGIPYSYVHIPAVFKEKILHCISMTWS